MPISEGTRAPPLGTLLRLGDPTIPESPQEFVEVMEHGNMSYRLRRGALQTGAKDWPEGTLLTAIAFDAPAR